ncbi:hypothetical protein [Lysobacter sp. A289]
MLPNNSFKPNLLRYSKSVAQKACHAFASTTQVGLIQALGLMTVFWKKPTFQDPQLGLLSHSGNVWQSKSIRTVSGEVLVSLEGGPASPDPIALAMAHDVLPNTEPVVKSAMAFALAHPDFQEFMAGNGDIALDGFSFKSSPDTFDVELALSEWPDAMITVVCKGGIPCGILLAD